MWKSRPRAAASRAAAANYGFAPTARMTRCGVMERQDHTAIYVDLSGGMWRVTIPGMPEGQRCANLRDARTVAYAWAIEHRPCQLVVRDAYHRVLADEVLERETATRVL
jgi:hypothetical protein